MNIEKKKQLRKKMRNTLLANEKYLPLSHEFIEQMMQEDPEIFLSDYLQLPSDGYILSFFPMKGEIDVSSINSYLCSRGRLLLPKVMNKNELSIFFIPEMSSQYLISNEVSKKYQITEPDPSTCTNIDVGNYDQIKGILVPGLAFDRNGRRLGRGAGYYDRFLSSCPGTTIKTGIAYKIQMVENIPTTETDIDMDCVISF